MSSLQSGSNVTVAYKVQSARGTPSSGGSGLGLRLARGSPGLRLQKAIVPATELRRDGQSTRGRHGSRSVAGSYNVPLCLGELDTLLEAALRGTWVAAASITQATMTSITTTTTTIVASAGSWITQGVRVGDKVQLTGHSTAANNGKWFRVTAVTASTITCANIAGVAPLVLDAGADSSFTLTVAKTLLNGTTPTERYFTFDQYYQDVDVSHEFDDVKVNKISLSARPNQEVLATVGLIGLDGNALATGSSPLLTSPTYTTNLPMQLADNGTVRINGVDYGTITGFDLTLDLGGQVPPVLAANPPDAFLDNAQLSGSISCIKTDDTFFSAFDNETQIAMAVDFVEVESDPKDFISIYVGNAVFNGNDDPITGSGPLIETIAWSAGKDEAGSAQAATTLKISTSAP
jgi:hypothetical protein